MYLEKTININYFNLYIASNLRIISDNVILHVGFKFNLGRSYYIS